MVDFYKFAAPMKSIGVGPAPGPSAPVKSGVTSFKSPLQKTTPLTAAKATAPVQTPPAPASSATLPGGPATVPQGQGASSIWAAVAPPQAPPQGNEITSAPTQAPRAPQATSQGQGTLGHSVETIQDKQVAPTPQSINSGKWQGVNEFLGKQQANAPKSLQGFQEDLERRQPGSIENSRRKADASTYAAKGVVAPEYQAQKGVSFTPTNDEQAQRMGVKSPSGNFVNPQDYERTAPKHNKGYAYAKNETTGATAEQGGMPGWSFPNKSELGQARHNYNIGHISTDRQEPVVPAGGGVMASGEAPPLVAGQGVLQKKGSEILSTRTIFEDVANQIVIGELTKLSSEIQLLGKSPAANIQKPITSTPPTGPVNSPLPKPQATVAPNTPAKRDWNAEPAKQVTYGGQPVDNQEVSLARFDRDAQSKKLIDQNSQILNREKATDQNLFSRVNGLKQQIGQNRADQMNGMAEANNRLDKATQKIDYAQGVPAHISGVRPTQATASQGYEDLQKGQPQRRTVSQLERLYSNNGFGVSQTPAAMEAMVDEAGQGPRADSEAYLRDAQNRQAEILDKNAPSGLTGSFWDRVARK